jgi:hypothetical protein
MGTQAKEFSSPPGNIAHPVFEGLIAKFPQRVKVFFFLLPKANGRPASAAFLLKIRKVRSVFVKLHLEGSLSSFYEKRTNPACPCLK